MQHARPETAHQLAPFGCELHGWIRLAGAQQVPGMRELVDEATDVFNRPVLQQPEGTQPVVASLHHAFARLSGEYGRHVSDAESLPRTDDTRQDLLRDEHRLRNGLELAQAPVAGAARSGFVLLSEILDQRTVTA